MLRGSKHRLDIALDQTGLLGKLSHVIVVVVGGLPGTINQSIQTFIHFVLWCVSEVTDLPPPLSLGC